MFTIWGRLNSHNVKKVVWAAVEAGLAWERHDIGGAFGYTPDYLALNPNRMVPTIQDGDFTLWESNTILRYIADGHAPHLWMGTARDRALADRWLDWQITFADAQRDAFWQMIRIAPDARDHAAIERSVTETNAMMAILEDALNQKPWLAGDSFGIADIPMGVYVHTWLALGLDRIAAPHVRAWYERLQQRPGYEYVTIPLT